MCSMGRCYGPDDGGYSVLHAMTIDSRLLFCADGYRKRMQPPIDNRGYDPRRRLR